MKFIRHLLFVVVFISSLTAEDDLSSLLERYKSESDLSNVTKQESAGFVDIYTRKDLERMQVRNLQDILASLSSIYYTRTINNLIALTRPTIYRIPMTTIRLYINDHDITSTSFGSGFLVWGDMSIEHIDHIEVYKSTSSIEFGNETAMLVIRLYTKSPKREEGGKLRGSLADNGSYDISAYYARQLQNDLSYFVFMEKDDIDRDVYHNYYENKEYDFDSDKCGHSVYANVLYKKWSFEIGSYKKSNDSFIGIGVKKTPEGGSLDASHSYVHLTKEFDNGFKVELAADKLEYKRTYHDPNGIKVSNVDVLLENFKMKFDDEIYSVIAEKETKIGNNRFVVGGFYKRKSFDGNGLYDNTQYDFEYRHSFDNYIDLYSLYFEDNYDVDEHNRLIFSVKNDSYRYDKDVKSHDKTVIRAGIVSMYDKVRLKLFGTKSYQPHTFYQIYNPQNIPYKANPKLDMCDTYIVSLSLLYKTERSEAEFIFAQNTVMDIIKYDRASETGFYNSSQRSRFTRVQVALRHRFDLHNKIAVEFFTGENSFGTEYSPKYSAVVKSFNKYGKFDFYNELYWKSGYTYAKVDVDPSLNFTSSVKYHYSDDLRIGVRGENIFDSGFEEAYKGLSTAIPVIDQRFWLNLEYLF